MNVRGGGRAPTFARFSGSILAAALVVSVSATARAEDPRSSARSTEAGPTPGAEATGIAADASFAEAEPAAPLLGPDVERTVGPPSGPPRTGEVLRTELERLSATIRCPVCQSHSINDSPSESARNMKGQVRGMLAAGYDDEQIYRYLESGYGEFIRLMPRREGWNLLVWLLPALAVLVGGGVAVRTMRTPRAESAEGPSPSTGPTTGDHPASPRDAAIEHEAAVDQPQERWLRRVREEVDR